MSFTIKCDNCGHIDKFTEKTRKHKQPIIVYTKTEDGDVPDWPVLECSVCGHIVEKI